MNLLIKSVTPIWLLAAVGAVLVGVLSHAGQYFVMLPVVLGVIVILTFVVQLGLSRPEGFVDRVAASIAGAMVILAAATLVLL
ncbi:MAG: putative rane protein [Subtercola sp.]|nr:putative rane protein [Subtercola sp.]